MVEETGSRSSGPSFHRKTSASPNEDSNRQFRVDQFTSKDQVRLLDAIDLLRQEHLAGVLNVPQIVVCGDQSCGKSSVLEAIAGVSFPLGSDATTRFATELILRKSDKEDKSIEIIASPDRSADERKSIQSFQPPSSFAGPQDLKKLIEEAQSYLRQKEPKNSFWKDRLRVEIFGPHQPHLTLVDLPGIIHYESEKNAAPGDAEKIRQLTKQYLENERTTVLAVVDAFVNIENQEIIGLASKLAEDRTLGVLTKVDVLPSGSDLERNAISTARNQKDHMSLGWHVLANLRHDLPEGRSSSKRDELERQRFSEQPWCQLSPENLGIQALRKKLSDHLFRSITLDLDRLVGSMKQQREQCSKDISGSPRETVPEQRKYLGDVLEKFSRLIEDGVDGSYGRKESENFFGASTDRELRDAIRGQIDAFAERMKNVGRRYHIYLASGERDFVTRNQDLEDLPETETLKFSAPFTTGGNVQPYNVSLKRYCSELAQYMQRTRGTELDGITTSKTIRAVFRQLSLPWKGIVEHFAQQCYSTVLSFLKAASKEAGGDHTGEALLQAYVLGYESRFQGRRQRLNKKMDELLWPYTECHLMTKRSEFNPRSAWETYTNESRGYKTWGDLARETGGYSVAMIDAADVLVQTESYYKLALDTLIDNFASLGIEQCLLKDLSRFVEPSEVHTMDDELVTKLAAEPPEEVDKRKKAERQVAVLDRVIATCLDYIPPEKVSPPPIINLEVPPQSRSQRSRSAPGDRDSANPARARDFMESPLGTHGQQTKSGSSTSLFANIAAEKAASGPGTPVTSNKIGPPSFGSGGGLFAGSSDTSGGGLSNANSTNSGGGLFGAASNASSGGGFGGFGSSNTSSGGGLFGAASNTSRTPSGTHTTQGASAFGAGGSLFGRSTNDQTSRPGSNESPWSKPDGQNSGGTANGESSKAKDPKNAFGFGKSQPTSYYTPTGGTKGHLGFPYVANEHGLPFSSADGPHENLCKFESLTMHHLYRSSSFEELRLDDYIAGRIRPDAGTSIEV